jgi:hypothetical protein
MSGNDLILDHQPNIRKRRKKAGKHLFEATQGEIRLRTPGHVNDAIWRED